jgi:polyvinyl alcohol dehydrogenase (cytochrome)
MHTPFTAARRTPRWRMLAATALAAILSGCAAPGPAAPAGSAAAVDAEPPHAIVAGPHPGETVYKERCAACHDNSEATRSPNRDTLGRMPAGQIVNAMVAGKMMAQAVGLSPSQIDDVAAYLSAAASDKDADKWMEAMACPTGRRAPKLDAKPTVGGFGFDKENTRRLTYSQAGLKASDFGDMELAWAIAFPAAVSMRSQAAVVGDSLFIPVGESNNRLFAFDISKGQQPCLQWVYDGGRTLRSSAGFGTLPDGRKGVMVGDMGGYVHMIDARTGKRIWETRIGLFEGSIITGTPVLWEGKVYAPSSQFEIMMAGQDSHVCCKIHGGVVAVDAITGAKVWEGHTMPNAEPIRDRGDGQMLWGPAGAPIWNSPSIDPKRNRLYVGTGEANSIDAHPNTDALMAFNLTSGKIEWSFQATENDVFNVGCGPNGGGKNCTANTVFRDVDFGASTILTKDPSGREMLLAGQKSGTVWAMNPDNGTVLWRTDIGTGGPNGGIHWGIAADDTHVYAPISYPGRSIPGQEVSKDLKPGLYAVNLKDGTIDWKFEATPDCTDARKKFVPRCNTLFGLSGAPTVIGDHVVTGGLDGRVYVLERKTGKLVQTLETARDFDTVNGVKGNGASVDNASIIAANGLLFVNSGYGLFSQGAGNVMLAFKAKD